MLQAASASLNGLLEVEFEMEFEVEFEMVLIGELRKYKSYALENPGAKSEKVIFSASATLGDLRGRLGTYFSRSVKFMSYLKANVWYRLSLEHASMYSLETSLNQPRRSFLRSWKYHTSL